MFTPKQPGYAALDGVRAAEGFAPLGLSGTDTPVAAAGYSGGSIGTRWAAQVQPTYAPEIRLVGVAMGGWTAPIGPYLESLDSGPFSGFLPSLLPGMMRADPRLAAAFNKYLTPAGQALMAARARPATASPVVIQGRQSALFGRRGCPGPQSVSLSAAPVLANSNRAGCGSSGCSCTVVGSVDGRPAPADYRSRLRNPTDKSGLSVAPKIDIDP
ncbi:lipase family protein [Nocardia sp. NPDC059228]|uniref:lipase family protein n=1 Tax=Nocardia sp. NPDC059228 TaxID=3346777 RepID=UPI00367D883A